MKESKMPHIDKAVGIPSAQVDQQIIFEDSLTSKFTEGGKKFPKFEIEKSDKDIDIINFTQNAVDDYLKKYNRNKKVNTPIENIHLFDEGGVEKVTGGKTKTGAFSTLYGDIIVDRARTDIQFSLRVFHELMHSKSFTAAQITTGNPRKVRPYRTGFCVESRDGSQCYFEDVNEAIVGLLTRRFYTEYIEKNKAFKDDMQKILEENIPIDFSRESEVQSGLKFINRIYELNKEKYSLQDVTDIFIDAGINGNLVKVARLIESSFGKGSFRALGEETSKLRN